MCTQMLLKLALDGDQPQCYWFDQLLAIDGCHNAYVVVNYLSIIVIQVAKTISFHVHFTDTFECTKERF